MAGQLRQFQDVSGALLLIAALFALGLFNFRSDEPLVEAGIAAQARAVATGSVHGLTVQIDGRDIHVSGLADSPHERQALLEALRGIEGRGRLRHDITVLERADPFAFQATRGADGALQMTGAVPTETQRRSWRREHGDTADTLTLAAGMPDAHWPGVIENGLRALKQLEHGRLRAENRHLTLSGAALTPDAAGRIALLMENLPQGYVFTPEFEVLDDGTPLRLSASRLDGGDITLSGKLPPALAGALPEPSDGIALSPLPEPVPGWGDAVQAGLAALGQLHSGQLVVIGRSLTLTGEAWSNASHAAAVAAMDSLPQDLTATVQVALADSGAAFALRLDYDGKQATASGKVPRSLSPPVLAALLDRPVSAATLEIARIAPGQAWWDMASIGTRAMRYLEHGTLTLAGQGLRITGTAFDPQAHAAFASALDGLPGGTDLTLDIALTDDGSPQRMVLRYDGAIAVLSGKLPESLAAQALSESFGKPLETGDLTVTPKPAAAGWAGAAQAGAGALALLLQGQARLEGQVLHLSGILRDPKAERAVLAALAALPDGYEAATDLSFLDDGRPFAFTLEFDGQAARLSGKVPRDLGPASQGAILGHAVSAGKLEFSAIGADPDWWRAARAGIKALSLLDKGRLRMDSHQITLEGTGGDARKASQRLAPFQDAFRLRLTLH